MKRTVITVITFLCIISCSTSDNPEEQLNELSLQALTGNWEATKFTILTNAGNFDFNVGQQFCETVDVSTLPLSEECSGIDVERCDTREDFTITFSEIGVYDRTESYTFNNPEVNASNNCEIIYWDSDAFDGFNKGSWELNVTAQEIIIKETYEFIKIVLRGEEREFENFDQSEFVWKILNFSATEMKIFWRTTDQIDYEISFRKV